MKINFLKQKNKIKLEGYGENKFIVSGKEYNHPILILPNSIKEKKKMKKYRNRGVFPRLEL